MAMELTQALWEFVSSSLKFKPATDNGEYEDKAQCFEQSHDCDAVCSILGVDLDPTLILRAVEGNLRKDVVHFECCDVMNETELKQVVGSFFGVQELDSETKFDAVFLFSVTMWIHLNCGDNGLRKLLLLSAKLAKNLIVIEPQLWKCYSAAKRRCTRAGGDGFPLLPKLTLRSDEAIENEISKVLCEAGFKKISEYKAPKWKRKIILYQSCAVTV
ncbi:probable RNA methyltransferase CG11342 [Ischnura elegans]|uniref:probable RNA methyltransferase CG11342 n=1 Tax=Ischnura elegans TaxID=197161 RepID=UPI001ED8A170|nr:probable RNA methyltransferase CG11342 [Ischnura elegans]